MRIRWAFERFFANAFSKKRPASNPVYVIVELIVGSKHFKKNLTNCSLACFVHDRELCKSLRKNA